MDANISQLQAGILGKNPKKVQYEPLGEPKTAREISAKKAADEFEAIFISQMLKSMSAGIKTDGPFGGGQSEKIYRELMDEQMGETIARNGGVGISDAIYREMLKNQEVSK